MLDHVRRWTRTTGRVVMGLARNSALRRVSAAFLLFRAVETGTWIAILLYAYQALGREAVGLVAVVQLVPPVILTPMASSLGDRLPRHRLLFIWYVIYGLSVALVAWGMLAGASPLTVIGTAVVAGVLVTFVRPTHGALLPGLARTPEELTAANGVSGSIEGLGLLGGPLVAAGVLAVGGPGEVLAASAVALFAGAALVARLPPPLEAPWLSVHEASDVPRPEGEERTHAPTAVVHGHPSLLAGVRLLLREPEPRLIVGLIALKNVTVGALDVLAVLLAIEILGTGESGASLLAASLGFGMVAGGGLTFLLVGRPRLGPALVLSALCWGLALGLVALGPPGPMVPLLIALGGVGHAVYDVAGRTILQRVTPHGVLAGVLGGLEGVGVGAMAVGSILVPAVAALGGVNWAVAVAGVVLPAGALAAWAALRGIDRHVEVPVRALHLLRATPIFAPLPPAMLEAVGRRVRWVTVEPGEVVIREGDRGDHYYVVESGRFRVTKDGRELRVYEGGGMGFGEIALLRDVPRTATITALDAGVLLALERIDFLEAMTGDEAARSVGEGLAAAHAGRS